MTAPADPFVATFTGATCFPAPPSARGTVSPRSSSTAAPRPGARNAASGRVDLAVYPWDITLAREQPDSSLINHLRGPITSIVPIGDRARVRVGQIVAEITAASARRLELREGDMVIASFKATAARLVSL